jgi:AraC-like DNA-binding protein
VDLDVLWGPVVETLRDRLQGMRDLFDRLSLVESTIANRVPHRALAHDARRVRLLYALACRTPRISIAELAASQGMSHRSVIALLEQTIGLKPKLMQRVQRVRRVLREIHVPPAGPASWSCIAHRCGYFDQAHLINDFRALTGLTPTEYDAKRSSVGRGFAQYIAAADR